MAIGKSVIILILCSALAINADQKEEIIFNVKNYGAIDDGETYSGKAFVDAWKAACHESTRPAKVLVPLGRYSTSGMTLPGPCNNGLNPITFEVQGTILAPTDKSDFMDQDWVSFKDVHGLKIFGGGTLDGRMSSTETINDEYCIAEFPNKCIRHVANLAFHRCSNVLVQGIRSVNPEGFHVFLTDSTNMRLRELDLVAHGTNPIAGGIQISLSNNVTISRNTIATAGDCISLIHGSTNVLVKNIKCGPGRGFIIGSLGKYEKEVEVKGIHIKNCTLNGTTNGLRISSWPDRNEGSASDISFSDIIMQDVNNPIVIDQEYQCEPAQCKKKPSVVKIQNVNFSNISGTTISPLAVDLRCSKLYPCQNVSLRNIDLKVGLIPTTSRCMNIKPLFEGLLMPPACM